MTPPRETLHERTLEMLAKARKHGRYSEHKGAQYGYALDCVREVAALRAENARLVKECDDLSEANWDMRKRLAMAEAEIARLRGATPDTR